jgi:Fe-S cluster assembly protein SufD
VNVAPLKLPWATSSHVRATSSALGEPDWLLADRLAALEAVTTLSAEPNQLFITYLDLRAVDLGAVEPYPPVMALGSTYRDREPVPAGATALVHVNERGLSSLTISEAAREAGLVIGTLHEVVGERPELVRDLIEGGRSLPGDDAFGQVARAFATLGIVIHVPDGLVLDRPIVLRWSMGAPGFGLISRTIVRLGRDARATLFEEHVASREASAEPAAKADSLWWGTTEIDLADGAILDVAGEQDFGPGTAAFVTRQARVGRDATVNWALASVGSRLQRSRIENLLEGRGGTVNQVEIGFGDGRQLFDLTSYTRHVGEDTTSDLLSKGVFSGSSRGYIKGLIDIARSARGTDTFLGEFSMLLAKTARSVTIPSLEIDQPDVRRAMHSSSVGPIDENQVFYLMTRGLSRAAARKAIVLGFLDPVVARIPLPEAQERLRGLLERKWPAEPSGEAAA